MAESVFTTADGEHMIEWIQENQERHLIPLKEDLAEWLNRILDIDFITAENFMNKLDNGVIVCKLAKLIQSKADEYKRQGYITKSENGHHKPSQPVIRKKPLQKLHSWTTSSNTEVDVPIMKFKIWENAKAESFFARDNTENFLKWCSNIGIHEAVMFESDGLVMHHQPRTVVLCLLELARCASKYGIDPSGLVKLEKEIDLQEHKPSPPHTLDKKGRSKKSELDSRVAQLESTCRCEHKFHVDRISEGMYNIGGKVVFVRLLKGRHLMVRVGGGWDTLEHYLSRHDPCKIVMVKRENLTEDESFLVIKSKYRSNSVC